MIDSLTGAAERRFRALIENSQDAVALLSPEGVVLYASPSTARVLGTPPERLLGDRVFDRLHPHDRAPVGELFARLVREPGERMSARFRYRHEDGSWRWLEAIGFNLLDDPAVEAVVVNYRDITRAKRAEDGRHFLIEASGLIGTSLDFDETLRSLARLIVTWCADYCLIDLADGEGGCRRVAAAHADPAREGALAALHADPAGAPPPLLARALAGEAILVPALDAAALAGLGIGPGAPGAREALAALETRTLMVVPLRAREQTLGMITFAGAEPGRAFDGDDLAVAEALGRRAAVALDNARLYAEAQQAAREREEALRDREAALRAREAAVLEREQALQLQRSEEERLLLLAEASNAILPHLQDTSVVEAVLDLSRRLLRADAYALWRQAPDEEEWRLCHASSPAATPEALMPPACPIGGEPLQVPDVQAEPVGEERRAAYLREGIRALLTVPLLIHGESCGSLTFYSREPRDFDPVEVRIASALASLAGSAITTAELYDEQRAMRREAERARQRLVFLAEASAVLGSSLDYDRTLEHIARLVVPHLAEWCAVHVVEEDGQVRQVAAAHAAPERAAWIRALDGRAPLDPAAPDGLGQVLRSGCPELIPGGAAERLAAETRDEEHLRLLREAGLDSCMIVPLAAHGRVLGALVFAAAPGVRYGPVELQLAEELAGSVAAAIENARLYRAAQEALAARTRSEARFRRLVEANILGVYFAEANGRITDANDAFLRLIGASREELEAGTLRWDVMTPPELRHLDRRALEQCGTAGACEPYEKELVRPDGGRVPVLIAAARLEEGTSEGVAFVLDLSDRKRSEAALRAIASRARCLLWYADVEEREGPFLRWEIRVADEEAAQRFLPLHVPPGSSYGRQFTLCRLPEDRDRMARYGEAQARAGRSYRQEYRARGADGEVRWLAEDVQMEPAGPGRWRAVGVCTDITERKRLEEELRQRADALAAADRRKDQFLAMLAHELRNPLGAISNSIHVLQHPSASDGARDRAVEVLKRQVQHQARLVDDLLDVSRITRGRVEIRREPVDLGLLVRHAAEDYRAALEREGIELELDVAPEPARVIGDATRLSQVLGNLLNNALKFTRSGGRIGVSLRVDPGERAAEVRVRDTGIGIAPELLPHIFETFTQGDRSLDRTRGGLGLGLALARALVELHGGEIRAASDGLDRGSEFTVRLALAPAEPEPGAGGAPAGAAGGPLRVLVVEDNRDGAETLRDILELAGHETRLAFTGPAGIETALAWSPHAILCDIGLPGMDGYEVAAALRREPRLAGCRLIAVTGYGQEEDRRRALESGFDHHLTKPISPGTLLSLLAGEPAAAPADP